MTKSGKGSSFERAICTKLSLWWSDNEHDDIFWRSQTSGARATQRKKKGKQTRGQDGDVASTHSSGESLIAFFSIELKRGYNKLSLHDCLDAAPTMKQQPFANFIEQAVEGHRNAGSRYWMLIFKRDRRVPMVFIPKKAFQELYDRHLLQNHVKQSLLPYACTFSVKTNISNENVFGCTFDLFLENFHRNDFEEDDF